MRKSATFVNILYLLKLYLKESFHGVLQQSFLKNKKSRWSILLFIIGSYLFYFYLNVVEFAKLSRVGELYSFEELKTNINLSIGSYNNLSLIAGIFIFILMNSIVSLKTSSLFLAKTMPYSETEVYWSVKLFKLGLALILFELFFIILIPGLGVLQSITVASCLFFSCHFFFLISYLCSNLLYNLLIKHMGFAERKVHGGLILVYFLFALSYLFVFKFQVEFYLAQTIQDPIQLSLLLLGISFLMLVILLLMDKTQHDAVFLPQKFIPILSKIASGKIIEMVALATMRTKFFLHSSLFIMCVALYSLYIGGMTLAGHNTLDFWPFLGMGLIHYGDSTLRHRRLYPLLRLGTKNEFIGLFLFVILLALPVLFLGVYLEESLFPFIQTIAVSLVSLMIGFLFPKSVSSTNETISFVLLLLSVTMLYIIMKVPILVFPIVIALITILIYIIKTETETVK